MRNFVVLVEACVTEAVLAMPTGTPDDIGSLAAGYVRDDLKNAVIYANGDDELLRDVEDAVANFLGENAEYEGDDDEEQTCT